MNESMNQSVDEQTTEAQAEQRNQSYNQPRVAILIEQRFEDSEFQVPYRALQASGADVYVVGPRMNERYQGKRRYVSTKLDITFAEIRADRFDAIVIPGGHAPDYMRSNRNVVRFVQQTMEQEKIIATVCHGPQVLIEADVIRGKRLTGFHSIRRDLENAGSQYVNEPLVVDTNLITARRPGDLVSFTTALLSRLGLKPHDGNLPDDSDIDTTEAWTLAEAWGGSSRREIVTCLNVAIRGERYGLHAFEKYAEKTSDLEVAAALREICVIKEKHIQMLKARLAAFDGNESFLAANSAVYARFKHWFRKSKDNEILRRALGDLQTGVVDAYRLQNSLTDPITVAIFDEIVEDLSKNEQWLASLYQARTDESLRPAKPTTGIAVTS